MVLIPITDVVDAKVWRAIPSRFPPIGLFERVASPADLDDVFEIEAMTNDRLREQVGDLQSVPPEDRTVGPGASFVMAAFTHWNPDGSRFSDGTFGVYYAAGDIETAIAETKHHREKFLRATNEAPIELDMRVLIANLTASLHDLRGLREVHADVYSPDDHGAGQVLAARLRDKDSDGIAYNSVRRADGECFAVFRPRLLSRCRQERHLTYCWDGSKITTIYEKSAIREG